MAECMECAKSPNRPKRPRKIHEKSGPRSPRCGEHYRAMKAAQKQRSIDRRGETVYGVPAGTYEALKEFQGGKCYICARATGESRALSFDHDHELAKLHDHPEAQACEDCLRGLLDHDCNVIILGRYSDEQLLRAIEYRRNPPYQQMRRNRNDL